MSIFNIAGAAIVTAVLAIVMRQQKQEYSTFIGVAAGIMLLLFISVNAAPVFEFMGALADLAKLPQGHIAILFKSLGICYVTQFAADVCRDAGETGIAGKVELAGKIVILVLAMPMFETVLKMAVDLINR